MAKAEMTTSNSATKLNVSSGDAIQLRNGRQNLVQAVDQHRNRNLLRRTIKNFVIVVATSLLVAIPAISCTTGTAPNTANSETQSNQVKAGGDRYFINANGSPITNLEVKIFAKNVTVPNPIPNTLDNRDGFSIQLNCYTKIGDSVVWIQYVLKILPSNFVFSSRLNMTGNAFAPQIEAWYPDSKAQTSADITGPTYYPLPDDLSGASFIIRLTNDSEGRITGCTFTVNYPDPQDSQSTDTKTTNLSLGTLAYLQDGTPIKIPATQIFAFSVDSFVGTGNGSTAVFDNLDADVSIKADQQLSASTSIPSYANYILTVDGADNQTVKENLCTGEGNNLVTDAVTTPNGSVEERVYIGQ
jgi:hypothetical protein